MLDYCVNFYQSGASDARVIAMPSLRVCLSVCLSVCVCVTRRYCIKTAKRRITQTTPRDSPGTLSFLTPKFVGGWPLFPLNFALKVTHPFQTAQFRPIFAHSASTVSAGEKVQLALIGSRPRAFQQAIGEPCTLPLTPPKGSTKRNFAIFFSKLQLLRKKSATKFLCVKTSNSKVVATSFLYLRVHRWIAGDVPIYL